MSDNTQELREKIRHYLISTQQDGAGIATGRRSTDGSLYKSRIDEFTEMIMSDIKSQTNQAVLEALDIIETDIIGIAPACTPDCNQTQRAYHQGGWDLMTKQEEKLDTLRQELSGGTD